jgi:hypothetical protein
MSEYSGLERKIAFVLIQFPGLKLAIKKAYQRLNYMRYKKDYTFKSDYKLTKLMYEDKESFFGYYDKSPMNSSNEYIIFQASNVDTKKLPDVNVAVDMVVYDIKNDSYEVVDKSYTYNWQQGTKLMWVSEFEFIFNSYNEEKNSYISKIYNIKTKKIKQIDFPIYDCFEKKYAISLNFDRLNIGRADYCYSNRNATIDWSNNSDDGLYYIDLETGASELIVSIEDIVKLNHKDTMEDSKHKFNHIMISPNGERVMFMHRWFTADNRRYDTLWVCNIDGTEIEIIADDDMVSHCCWYDDESIFAYLRDKEMGDNYYTVDILTKDKKIIGDNIINIFGDGHPSVYKSKILFDTYPDKSRMKKLFLYDVKSNKLENLGEFLELFDFYAETRCDLHPRFSMDGKRVFFDSVHEGKRGLYMMDISE